MRDRSRRVRMIFTLLILTSLTLLTLDYQSNSDSPLRPAERVVGTVIGPIQRAIGNGMASLTGGIHFGTGQDKQIAALAAQNAALCQKLLVTDQMRNELDQLKALSGLADRWKPVPARVIGRGTSVTDEWTLLIDIGSDDGVKVQSTVITGAGLLGKIIRVGTNESTVRLLNDPNIGVRVNLARNGERGFVLGEGDGPMQLTMDSATARPVEGDVIVTTGSKDDRPFYPGIGVGVVSKVRASPGSAFRVADVRPFATPGTLQYVGVITGPGPNVPRTPLPRTQTSASPSAASGSASASGTASATGTASVTGTASPTGTASATGKAPASPSLGATPAATPTPTPAATPTATTAPPSTPTTDPTALTLPCGPAATGTPGP